MNHSSGGGALFLFLLPFNAVLNDVNADLINVWHIIKKDPDKLIELLLKFKEDYKVEKYNDYRKQFNAIKLSKNSSNIAKIEKAGLFILINKTCFNGLFRVNSKGDFNVPSNKANKFNFDAENIQKISQFLNKNQIHFSSDDFATILQKTKKDDLVYLDPPYDLVKKDSFTSYTKDKFLSESQERLSEIFQSLDKKGCKVILSNHKTELILKLYQNYGIYEIPVSRMINCKGDLRKGFREVIITNFNQFKLEGITKIPNNFTLNLTKEPNWYLNLFEISDSLICYDKEIQLLNQLIGHKNVKQKFFEILNQNNKILKLITFMFAVRPKPQNKIYNNLLNFWNISEKEKINKNQMEKIYFFIKKMGIIELLINKKIKDIYTYVLGVAAGMDTNARKNRTGAMMEKTVQNILENKLNKNIIDFFEKQKKINFIFDQPKEKFDFKLSDFIQYTKQTEKPEEWTELKNKKFDFVFKKKEKIYLVECNYYNTSGSKPYATIKQYEKLNQSIRKLVHNKKLIFIWISDGPYWREGHGQNQWKQIKKEKSMNLFSLKEFLNQK